MMIFMIIRVEFRVGHMGSINPKDIIVTLSAIEYALSKVGFNFKVGKSLETFQKIIGS